MSMEGNAAPLENTCSFHGLAPAMMALPYPPVRVQAKNRVYADLLSVDYCGAVSELSAITQYINNENRLSYEMSACQNASQHCDGGDDAFADAGRADLSSRWGGGFCGKILRRKKTDVDAAVSDAALSDGRNAGG